MTRVERLRPHQLNAEQAALYREITEGPRARGPKYFDLVGDQGELLGPFNAFLLSPGVGRALSDLGAAVRFDATLTKPCIEIVILTVAAHWESNFEWSSHEAVAQAVGLSDDVLSSIWSREIPRCDDDVEQATAALSLSMVAGDVGDHVWEEARAHLELGQIFEISTIVGYYSTLALQLKVMRADSINSTSERTTI